MVRPLCTLVLIAAAAGWVPLVAQVRSIAPYRHRGSAELEARHRAARLALPSLQQARRPLPAAHRLAPLTAEDLALKPVSLASRAGVHRALPASAQLASGRWEILAGGRALWRMAIQSPGAAGIRIHFVDFHLPAGARLWLHDGSGDEAEIMGPYEGHGIHGDGEFWSDFVLAETIVLEYQPGASAGGEALPFVIGGISHLLPGVLPDPPTADAARAFAPILPAPREAVSSIVQSLASPLGAAGDPRLAAASCNLDISCFPEWAQTARSVAHIVFEDGNSSFVCSGTLLATSDSNGIPYFLTADHCISSDSVARTVQAFWKYQTNTCDGPAPNRRDAERTLGARLVVNESVARGDYSLIRLVSVPNDVVFSGWTTETVNLGDEVVGIHHPTGDYKRFSRGIRTATGSQLRGADPAFYYTVAYREGLIEGGSSGSGLFKAPGVLAGMLSSGPKTETPCDFKPFPANYGRFALVYRSLSDFLEGRRTDIPTGSAPPAGGGTQQSLSPGEARSFQLGPVDSPTLFNGASGFAIVVPEGSVRLAIKIAVVEGGEHALGVWARYDAPPSVQDGRVVSDHASPGASGFEEIVIDAASSPPLRAGRYYIALGLFSAGVTVNGTITATLSGPAGEGAPSGSGTQLTPDTPARISIPAVSSARLFTGPAGYYVTVPAGTQRLELRLRTDQDVDLDLFANPGSSPTVQGGRVQSTYSATGATGNETLVISGSAAQPLGGTYYVGIAVFTTDVDISATLTAVISSGSGTSGPVVLRSGAPQSFSLPAAVNPQLVAPQYAIDVPAGAVRLEVRLSSSTPGVDLDLFARFNTPAAVASGKVQADYASDGATASEVIVITPDTAPALREGRYYLALAVFTTGKPIDGSIVATVVTNQPAPPSPGSRTITPASPVKFSLPAVTTATLFSGEYSFTVAVPQGTRNMQLRLASDAPSVDTDLFVRFGEDVSVSDKGDVVADHSAESSSGNELLTIGTGSQPPLRAGTYYVALALFTRNAPATGTISVTFERDFTPPPAAVPGRLLELGRPANYQLPASATPTLYRGEYGFHFDVPSTQGKLEVTTRAVDPEVDVDLYLRYGAEPAVENGRPVADHSGEGSTGNETVVVRAPALRAGTYFAAFGLFTANREARGAITATFTPASQPAGGLLKVFDLMPQEAAESELVLSTKPAGSAELALRDKEPAIREAKSPLVKALP